MTNSKQRLQQYRGEALNPRWVRPLTWRDTRQHHPSPWGAPRANNVRGPEGQIYSEQLDQYGADLGPVNTIFPRVFGHAGWYADNYQDARIVAHVCRMRSPWGTLYIPATRNTDCDGTVHYFGDVERVPKGATEEEHDSACREAARSADHYAEKEAEECREDNAKWQAEEDIRQAREEIHEVNKAVLALAREMKQYGPILKPRYICEALRAQIAGYLRDRAEQFKIIKEREDNYWSACPGY